MTGFTPWTAIAGGALIGLASAVLLLRANRIAGVSGILARSLFSNDAADRIWPWAFLVGLPLGAGIVGALTGGLTVELDASVPRILAAGLLVGFGTQLGNGCTSGHGVCGVSRGAPRSIVATGAFMAIAVLTVFLVRHGIGGAP